MSVNNMYSKVSPILIFGYSSFHLCSQNSQKVSSQYLIKLKPQLASRHFELFSRQQHDGKFHSFYSELRNKRAYSFNIFHEINGKNSHCLLVYQGLFVYQAGHSTQLGRKRVKRPSRKVKFFQKQFIYQLRASVSTQWGELYFVLLFLFSCNC